MFHNNNNNNDNKRRATHFLKKKKKIGKQRYLFLLSSIRSGNVPHQYCTHSKYVKSLKLIFGRIFMFSSNEYEWLIIHNNGALTATLSQHQIILLLRVHRLFWCPNTLFRMVQHSLSRGFDSEWKFDFIYKWISKRICQHDRAYVKEISS